MVTPSAFASTLKVCLHEQQLSVSDAIFRVECDFPCRMRFSVSDAIFRVGCGKNRIDPIFCEVSDATVASGIRSCKQTVKQPNLRK
jgi:hypothetical protein